jgi:dirigent-like protein
VFAYRPTPSAITLLFGSSQERGTSTVTNTTDESENRVLGRADGQCTTTSSPGPSAEARWVCNVTSTFSEEREGAEIDAQGVGRIEAEDVVFAVTGGTREFRDAQGQATFEYEGREDRIVITYEVDT